MFWKKDTAQDTSKSNKTSSESASKPCCAGSKNAETQENTQDQASTAPRISTFEFGGKKKTLHLVGVCEAQDPNGIEACIWSPERKQTKHRVYF